MFQLFNTFKDGPTFTSLDHFMQTATEQEKDLVDKTMRLIYDKHSLGKESVRNVQKWLDTASAQGILPQSPRTVRSGLFRFICS